MNTTSSEGVDLKKVYLVADYVAQETEYGFRGYLHGLARGERADMIAEDLDRSSGIKDYLRMHKKRPMNADELEYCASWGICVAKTLGVPGSNATDKVIIERLKKRTDCNWEGEADGFVPIGG